MAYKILHKINDNRTIPRKTRRETKKENKHNSEQREQGGSEAPKAKAQKKPRRA